jgi:hypothetical protein
MVSRCVLHLNRAELVSARIIMNKHFRICLINEEPTDHDCPATVEGSSGAMESAGLVQLAHSLLDEKPVIFETIIGDDDSSMRAHMKWSNADWMVNNHTNEAPS